MPTATKTVTARVTPELHQATQRLAEKRGESINDLVEKALAREVREQEERDFFDSFTLLGQDTEGASDIDFAFEAQSEVVTRAG